MKTCYEVADYFLSLVDEDAGDTISNMKLQKLVYYAQGFHLAIYGEPLFKERIEAWDHGPVIPDLYHRFKEYGSNTISKPDYIDFSKYSPEEKELLDEIWSVFGQYSAWKLRNMTHVEPPWRCAYENSPSSVISEKSMIDYFTTLLEK